ncbi:hypothetical protein [Paenibacillus sp. UNC451MF]|uniref:hypothetical protein n=1 Tax=Paenibacillus sp. UNC451MF TaxID=1449063 RepID=UPI00048A5083|nr:hypothetical protein [Paenibacillus sp. UNC451MF]
MFKKVQRNNYNISRSQSKVPIAIQAVNRDKSELHVTWSGEADNRHIRGDVQISFIDNTTIQIYKNSSYEVEVAWEVVEYF